MAPFICDECPICRRRTWQWFVLHEHAPKGDDRCWWRVCEGCKTVLVVERSIIVGQRAATERDLAFLPAEAGAAPGRGSS